MFKKSPNNRNIKMERIILTTVQQLKIIICKFSVSMCEWTDCSIQYYARKTKG